MRKNGIWSLTLILPFVATASWAAPSPALLTPGNISVEATGSDNALAPSLPGFTDAVGQALADKGFMVLDEAGHAGLVAVVTLTREQVGTVSVKASSDASGGGPSGLANAVGAAMTFTLPTAKTMVVPLQRTRLEVRIHKRGNDAVLWQGTAITIRPAGTPNGQDKVVASDLTGAILRDYPTFPEDVISVP